MQLLNILVVENDKIVAIARDQELQETKTKIKTKDQELQQTMITIPI